MLSREIVDCPQSSYYLLYNNQWILIWKYDAQKRTAVIKDGEIKMNFVRNNNTPTIFADMQCTAVKTTNLEILLFPMIFSKIRKNEINSF